MEFLGRDGFEETGYDLIYLDEHYTLSLQQLFLREWTILPSRSFILWTKRMSPSISMILFTFWASINVWAFHFDQHSALQPAGLRTFGAPKPAAAELPDQLKVTQMSGSSMPALKAEDAEEEEKGDGDGGAAVDSKVISISQSVRDENRV